MEESIRVFKGKVGGEIFLSKEVMNSCNGFCYVKRFFFYREKKICEIGRKWEKCIYWFFRRYLLFKGYGNIEIILLKEVNFIVVLFCIIEIYLMYFIISLWYLLRFVRLNLYEW